MQANHLIWCSAEERAVCSHSEGNPGRGGLPESRRVGCHSENSRGLSRVSLTLSNLPLCTNIRPLPSVWSSSTRVFPCVWEPRWLITSPISLPPLLREVKPTTPIAQVGGRGSERLLPKGTSTSDATGFAVGCIFMSAGLSPRPRREPKTQGTAPLACSEPLFVPRRP